MPIDLHQDYKEIPDTKSLMKNKTDLFHCVFLTTGDL